jgi:hippurate hydrolase
MKQKLLLSVVACLAASATTARAEDPAAMRAWIDAGLVQQQESLEEAYTGLHAHAEVAFQEHRTAAFLADEMRALGFEVTESVGGTGVVAMLHNGEGPTVMVRTDMDALPMEEKTGLPYASRNMQVVDGAESFTMHACGHDMHMTWWLGAAQLLSAHRDKWGGTLMFIAQPAEEVLGGAQAMLDDGLFTRFPRPDFAIAAHTNNGPAGTVEVKDGTVASSSDAWRLVFHGRGGHGSMPSQTIDPIVIAARFVTDVQSVVAREKPEHEFGVLTIGSFQAGTVNNIIPDTATLQLTLRAFDPDVRALLNDGMRRTAAASAAMAGAPEPELIHLGGASPLTNDSALVARAMEVLSPALGEDVTYKPAYLPGAPPSEDFALYVSREQGVPGLFLNVGVYSPARLAELQASGEPVPANHSPQFAPDPGLAIAPGARALVLSVLSVAGS